MTTSADERRRAAFALLKNIQEVTTAAGASDREARGDALVAALDNAEAELAGQAAPAAPSLGAAGARVRGFQRQSPAPATANASTAQGKVLTASGLPINDAHGLGTTVSEAIRRASRYPAGVPQQVLSAEWNYPAERSLDSTDAVGNGQKMDALLSPAALVASGGICGPVDIDFTVPVIANDARPLRDGLPVFGAKRGGLRYLATPTLSSSNAAAATTVWTEATDASPGGATKPVLTITCGTEAEVFVDAIPSRVKLGNLQALFAPEYANAVTELVMTEAARVAELNMLGKISAGSTTVSSGQLLGASRDLLTTVDQVVAGLRYRHRMPEGMAVTVVLPAFLRSMIRSDLVRSMAHGGELTEEWDLSDAQVDSLLTARGAQPIWLVDGPDAATVGGISVPAQGFGAQAAGPLLDFPKVVSWWAFPAGSWVALDGGRLDLNVIRDSVLSASNDLETFVEVFECVAYRGVESLEIVSTVRANGLSAGTVNTSTY